MAMRHASSFPLEAERARQSGPAAGCAGARRETFELATCRDEDDAKGCCSPTMTPAPSCPHREHRRRTHVRQAEPPNAVP